MSSFLAAVGIVCAITTVLAVLLAIVDVFINNYGQVKLRINDEKDIVVEGGKTLLSTLKEHEIFIPSACGGRGSCGLCKLEVVSGGGDVLPTETPWLSQEEINANIRLSCQVKVRNDISIRVPAEMLSVRQFRARVLSLRDLTYDIKEVKLGLLGPREIEFRAGQYIQLEVPPYELTNEPVYRAYSVASPPSRRNEIELEVRYVTNGICTTYVHKHLKEGDEVAMNGPYGDFHLSDSEREIIFIAGGSGMAPIKSILTDMKEKKIARKAVYFFGAKSVKDLFLVDEMRDLEKTLFMFKFIPALSAPESSERWDGELGLITEVVGRHIADAGSKEAYLCGSPLMIDACIKVLKEKGMPEEQMFYDKFA